MREYRLFFTVEVVIHNQTVIWKMIPTWEMSETLSGVI